METESQSCLRRIFPIVGEKWLLVSEVPKHSNLTKNRLNFSLMAPKDGLEQPTTGEEEPVEEDVEPFDEKPFAEADEVGRTPVCHCF